MPAVGHHEFEIFFDLPGVVVLAFPELLDDGGDIDGIFDFFIVIGEGVAIDGLPEDFRCLFFDEFVDHDENFFLDSRSLFAHLYIILTGERFDSFDKRAN